VQKDSDPENYIANFKTCLADLGYNNYNKDLCEEIYSDD